MRLQLCVFGATGILCSFRCVITVLCFVIIGVSTGCSSVISDPQEREKRLSLFLNQSERLVLYYPSPLLLDDQLKVLGSENVGEPVVRLFHPTKPTRGLIEQFIAAVPELAGTSTRIIDPEQWGSINHSPDTPVLFFHVTWKMTYQRLPPQFQMNRLQAGVIAKVIPLGQVARRKGTIALRTAAWEGKCLFDAFDGEYLPVSEWVADDGMKLNQAIKAAQFSCGHKLAGEFVAER